MKLIAINTAIRGVRDAFEHSDTSDPKKLVWIILVVVPLVMCKCFLIFRKCNRWCSPQAQASRSLSVSPPSGAIPLPWPARPPAPGPAVHAPASPSQPSRHPGRVARSSHHAAPSAPLMSDGVRCVLSAQAASLHSSAATHAAAKKTTTAAGGVMGLGKGKKKAGGKMAAMEKKEMPVESDPNRLVHFVCGSNIYNTGDDVQIKADSEYPAWLWGLHTGAPPRLQDLDPDSKQYWLRVRAAAMRRNNKLRSMRKI